MNPMSIIVGSAVFGFVAALVWVAFWSVLLPQAFSGAEVWAGYGSFTLTVFLAGCAVRLVTTLFSALK